MIQKSEYSSSYLSSKSKIKGELDRCICLEHHSKDTVDVLM